MDGQQGERLFAPGVADDDANIVVVVETRKSVVDTVVPRVAVDDAA